jgi:hypothetical protein
MTVKKIKRRERMTEHLYPLRRHKRQRWRAVKYSTKVVMDSIKAGSKGEQKRSAKDI